MTPSVVPLHVSPLAGPPVACGAVAFRHRGQLRVTPIVKATFSLVHDGVAVLTAPSGLATGELRAGDPPASSARAASDLVPYRPRVDVTFVGHAHASAAGPRAVTAVRLAVFREQAILDKTLHVYGDWSTTAPIEPRPFDRMPMVYERACGSEVQNPVGTARPNLVDPRDPKRPACFGPISADWPSRARLLGAMDRRALDAPVAEIPDAFDWRYFQAAPPDQQIDVLRGGEWIVLDGLHPTLPRLQTRLPPVAAVARVQRSGGPEGTGEEILALVLDTLAIDGDRQTCEVVWRASFLVPSGEAALPLLRIAAGLDVPGLATAAPARRAAPATSVLSVMDDRAAGAAPATPFEAARRPPPDTLDVPAQEASGMGLAAPFPLASPTAARPEAPPIAGAPWAALPVARPPEIGDANDGTLLLQAPPDLRAHAGKSAPAASHAGRAAARRAPALPLKGSVYGKPKPRK